MASSVRPDLPTFSLFAASKSLSNSAAELNAATKRLTKIVEDIEAGLQKHNLGISAWVPVSSMEDDSSSESLGYAKFNGRWCLVIREFSLNSGGDVESHEDCRLLDAPRDARIRAIGQVPALIDKLSADADDVTERLTKHLAAAETLAKLVNGEDVSTGGKK